MQDILALLTLVGRSMFFCSSSRSGPASPLPPPLHHTPPLFPIKGCDNPSVFCSSVTQSPKHPQSLIYPLTNTLINQYLNYPSSLVLESK